MHMLYDSESFAVVQFVVTDEAAGPDAAPTLARGGYELVDKHARKELFFEGALAEQFKLGVEALIQTSPSEDEVDEYLGRFSALMQQPVVLH